MPYFYERFMAGTAIFIKALQGYNDVISKDVKEREP